jgi:hypothetical protein
MYFTKFDFGLSGSGLRRYKYSAICLSTPIKTVFIKIQLNSEKVWRNLYGAGLRRTVSCFLAVARLFKQSGDEPNCRLGLLLLCFAFLESFLTATG